MKTFCYLCGKKTNKNTEGYFVCAEHGVLWILKRNAPVADALVIKNNQVLLIKRANDPFRGTWALPGGYVNHGEHPTEAAIRETKEETGIDIKITGISSIMIHDVKKDDKRQMTVFNAIPLSSKISPSDDALEAGWFDLEDLPQNMSPLHLEQIKHHQSGAPAHTVRILKA